MIKETGMYVYNLYNRTLNESKNTIESNIESLGIDTQLISTAFQIVKKYENDNGPLFKWWAMGIR